MNQQVEAIKNHKAVGWLALWAAVLLLSAVALFIGFGARQASAVGAASYTITDLGTLGGGTYSNAAAINNNGQVVGWANTGSGDGHTFLYEDGQMKDLGTLGGGTGESSAAGINDKGQLVGVSQTSDEGGAHHAFLYEDGQMKDLGTLGGRGSTASDINASGQAVGNSEIELGFARAHAFLYEDGQMKDLGTLGGNESAATAINASGQVVGNSEISGSDSRAFLYEDGQMKDLGTLPGGGHSGAKDINVSGQVVGVSEINGSGHAFLYEEGQMKDLGNLGGNYNFAEAINDNGQVVGTSRDDEWSATLYEDGQVKDLNSLIPQGSGWHLSYAVDINNNGQIVGYGYLNGSEFFRAFLLTPNNTPNSVDSASEEFVGAGGTVSTATGDGSASGSDPVNTTVTTPVAGTVSIQETSVSQSEPAGFSFFGQQVNIEAPQASVQNPLTLKFVIDSSLIPTGTDHTNLQLFRDGVRIEPCDSGASSTVASPDPCIKQRAQLEDGDVAITVLSSHASAWNFGVAKAGTPLYSFKGFLQPVDNLPTVNTVKAGAAVPVRFSLGGDKGLDIFMAGYPLSGQVPSDSEASLDQIEQTVTANSSGLSYSANSGQYTYTWKTDKAWSGQTRHLVMRLKDGTEHKARFKFTN